MGEILLREPSDAHIERFLDNQRSLPFSYPEVGASRDGAPPGYPVNHHHGRLGTGQQTFARAVQAIRGWKMYETGWTKLCWPEAPITEGTVVGVLGRHFGVWSLNACRIAYVIEEVPSLRRYGFALGTLPGHVERGEERFTVELGSRGRLSVLRGIRVCPSGPPIGQGGSTVRAAGPEAVRGRLVAEHGRSRRG